MKKSTLILLAVVVVLGIVAYSLSRRPASDELRRRRAQLLPELEADDAVTLIIESDGARIVCRRREEGDWAIAEPFSTRAESWQVQRIVDRLARAQRVWSIPASEVEEAELADYGLEPPRRRVTVSTEGEEAGTRAVRIGKPTGAADSVYAMVEQEGSVCAIEQSAAEATDVTLAELRSKRLAERMSVMDLQELSMAAAEADGESGFEVECVKTDGRWEVVSPFHDLADEDEVRTVTEELYGHRIEETDFVEDVPTDLAAYGLDEPELRLTLSDGERTQELIFGRRTEGEATTCYAMNRGEPAVISVPEELLTELRRGPAELRSRELLSLKLPRVASVSVSGPQGEAVVERQEGAWQIKGEPPAPADQDVMERLLHDLRDARVPEFVQDDPEDLSEYGLAEEQRRTVTVRDTDGAELARVVLGASADETHAYALRPGYPPVLLVSKERFYEPLAAGRLGLLDRTALSEPAGKAVRLVLSLEEGEFECLRDEQEGWRLVRPAEGPADEAAVRRTVGQFSALRAARYVAEDVEDLKPYGLDDAPASLTVTYSEPGREQPEAERERALLIGPRTDAEPEQRYAALAGGRRVFTLSEQKVEALTRPPASRTLCAAAELVTFTLAQGGRSVRFEYDGEREAWTDSAGELLPQDLDEPVKAAAGLLRSFEGVRVADYVKRDPASYGFDAPYLTVELDERTARGKRVVIGKATDGGRYATGPDVPWVVEVSAEQVATLEALLAAPKQQP